jgi:hypothetical protein
VSGNIYTHDPIYGWEPSIPEPFWVRSWRTLFRWRPACYECRITFKAVLDYQSHYRRLHGASR